MVWGAIIWSICAILWLARTNAKRRRVHGLGPVSRPVPPWMGWVLCLLPGLALLIFGTNADVVNWMGAVCAFGWLSVAVTPARLQAFVAWLDQTGTQFENYIQARLK